MNQMNTTSQVPELYAKLKASFESKNYAEANKIYIQIKMSLIASGALLSSQTVPQDLSLIIRDTLEIGAYLALFNKDMENFSKNIIQLQVYYRDPKGLADSPRMYPLLGLELLRCLVMNQLSQFHIYLEWLPKDVLMNNPYIKGPIALEQCLMEGSFHKAWLACSNVPGPEYQYFMEQMMISLREELAKCFEKAHASIHFQAAAKLLFCSSEQELATLIQKRHWIYNPTDKKIYFPKTVAGLSAAVADVKEFPIEELIKKNLFYADELERII